MRNVSLYGKHPVTIIAEALKGLSDRTPSNRRQRVRGNDGRRNGTRRLLP